ncbi:MAG: hypothetical protein HQ485_11605 [Acidobacteria bacterium]|nr:hypothetical protein [Acidobacteriota bacterium]
MRAETGGRQRVGLIAALVVLTMYGGLALVSDPVEVRRTPVNPEAVPGFQSDEATYYLMGQSLARDGDLEYRQEDIARARLEFAPGPNGVFLKRGVDVSGLSTTDAFPFAKIGGVADTDQSRLYFGKSFIYPLVAAPFVWLVGTKGFYLLNAALLALAFLCSYLFLSARSGIIVSVLLAGAFVFATVVPVYYAWIAPELFNFSIGLVAYFCWLYKEVSPTASSRLGAWLRRPVSDFVAAALSGVLTFSKLSNGLLVGPMVLWLLWKRRWGRAIGASVVWGLVTIALFGTNVAITGEWNYQGGLDRRTCYADGGRLFPFETDNVGFEVCDARATNAVQADVYFDEEVVWSNLRANIVYFVVGRNAGTVAYFFPCVLAVLTMLVAGRRREPWQWLVLGSLAAQALVFIISQPYSYFGGGGSVGNRYFMGAYGMAVFLFPPVRARILGVLPWIVGGAFMWPLVLSPFDTSMRPADHAKHGPVRLLPVELTNMNDLPINTERDVHVYWYGEQSPHPGFQMYRLDDNSYLREANGLSFWTHADSRAEILIKADQPFTRIQFQVTAGPVATRAVIEINGRETDVSLSAGEGTIVQFALPPGFKYKNARETPAYVWELAITTGPGFVPAEVEAGSDDVRHLGVRVLPLIVGPPR